eukprot:TRINITY_DN1073_c0_g1_i1.p1 TRINITY_DN1073_c0_g1~~TRINITY_DN1073_c0_g1_i1.p1  ORF type:complete len:494 (-),score=43.04 TRINITY_DN1073_c0_g1_i1:30-1511(-)
MQPPQPQKDINAAQASSSTRPPGARWLRPAVERVENQVPAARCAHSATELTSSVVVYGGWSGTRMLDDVFLLRAEASRSVSWFRPTLVDGTAPSARAGHSANIIPGHTSGTAPFQRLIIFGGGDGERYLNDLHALDVDEEKCTIRWRPIATSGASPSSRSRHAAVVVGHQLFVIGGGGSDGTVFGDVFILDLKYFMWREAKCSGAFSPRWGHTACPVRLANSSTDDSSMEPTHLVVFGGNDGSSMLNDVHFLCLETLKWIPATCSACPVPRAGHSSSIIFLNSPESKSSNLPHLVIFGGGDGVKLFNDVHLLPLRSQQLASMSYWFQPHIKGISPAARCAHTACILQNRVYVFGGGDSSRRFKDVYVLDTSNLGANLSYSTNSSLSTKDSARILSVVKHPTLQPISSVFHSWMEAHGLNMYIEKFEQAGLDSFDILAHLEEDHLLLLIPSVGHRLRFQHAVKQLSLWNISKIVASISQTIENISDIFCRSIDV